MTPPRAHAHAAPLRDPGGDPQRPLAARPASRPPLSESFFSRGGLADLVNERAQECVDGLWLILRPVLRAPGGRALVDRAPVVLELVLALQRQAEAAEFGNEASSTGSLVPVRTHLAPDDAGAAVGLSGRRVRQLCADGTVAHVRTGARGYLVDMTDLQRHLRGEPA